MLEHARNGSLRVQCDVTGSAPQQWHVTHELQCVAQTVTAADQHTFSLERFSAPRGFLVTIRASKTIAVQQGAITNAPGWFEITAAHVLPPQIWQWVGHPQKRNVRPSAVGSAKLLAREIVAEFFFRCFALLL